MKNPLLILFILMWSFTGYTQIDTALAIQLQSLVDEDQKWRLVVMGVNQGEIDTISESDALWQMLHTDSVTYEIIAEIFLNQGFLGYDVVGETGSDNFWLLAQHMDHHQKFQEEVLEAMKVEVDKGNASKENYAYLTDRVMGKSEGLQLYGTQLTLNDGGTAFELNPVKDPEHINERRAEMGLNPIEEYLDEVNKMYFESSNDD